MMEVYDVVCDFADGSTAKYEGLALMDLHAIVDSFENLSVMDVRISLDIHQRRARAVKYLLPVGDEDAAEGIRKWALHGDMSDLPDPVRDVLGSWEGREILAGRTIS